MQEIIVQSVPRVERVTERHRWETIEEVLRPRWLVKTRTVSFWGCLSLSTILYLFRCESTKGYRILKDKALKKTTLSEEFKICFKHGFGRQEAKCQLYRTLWLFLHQERTMTENHQVPLRFQFPALLRKHLSTTNSLNRKWQCVIFIFPLVSNIKRLLYNICGFSLSVKLYIVFQ